MVYVARAVADVANLPRDLRSQALLKARWSYFTSKPTGILVNSVGIESSLSGAVYLDVVAVHRQRDPNRHLLVVAFAVSWKLA